MNTSQDHNTSPYADIINLPRPIIKNHPPMSKDARAAQFAPYAALVGHKEIIQNVETQDTFDEPEIIPDFTEEYPEEYPENFD